MWRRYRNKRKKSEIKKYRINKTQSTIEIQLKERILLFKKEDIGLTAFETLIRYAKMGYGLQRYIVQNQIKQSA